MMISRCLLFLFVAATLLDISTGLGTGVLQAKGYSNAVIKCKQEWGCSDARNIGNTPGYDNSWKCFDCGKGCYCSKEGCERVPDRSRPQFEEYECCSCPSKKKKCFPSMARLTLKNGASVTMSQLKIGDKVQAVSSEGSVTYSEVRTFLEKDTNGISTYKSITTSLKRTIRLSGNHLIFTKKNATLKFHPIHADDVLPGDEVLIAEKDQLIPAKIINVTSSMMQGAWVPLTMEGNIMVDGVLASCYASVNHDVAHMAMMSVRWFPEIVHWIFGEENGSSVFSQIAKLFGKSVSPKGQLFETGRV